MRATGLCVAVALIALAASGGAARAQDKTYAQGYEDGHRDGYAAGLAAAGNGGDGGNGGGVVTGDGKNDIMDRIQQFQGGQFPSGDGKANKGVPDYFLVPGQAGPGVSGGLVSGGALAFYGKVDPNDPAQWNSIIDLTAAKTGLAPGKLTFYLLPVDPLVKGTGDLSGFVFDGAAGPAAAPKAFTGDVPSMLKAFGGTPLSADPGLSVLMAPGG